MNLLPTHVNTSSDLMSIALQAEREAIKRYTQLAEEMTSADNQSAAMLFKRMINEEVEHERLLTEWMTQEGIVENPDIASVKWKDPQISTTYDDEARNPYLSSPYRALAFAVHNEEIAFRFYSHVAAESKNEAVRKYAEILAREELGHAALLRAERRKAYQTERSNTHTEPMFDPKIIHNDVDLLTAAVHIDGYLLAAMQQLEKQTPPINSLIDQTKKQLAHHHTKLNAQSANNETLSMLEKLKSYNVYLDEKANSTEAKIKRLWSCCDRSFAFYDAIQTSTDNETIMLTAQSLTIQALDRISVLKSLFAELSNSDN